MHLKNLQSLERLITHEEALKAGLLQELNTKQAQVTRAREAGQEGEILDFKDVTIEGELVVLLGERVHARSALVELRHCHVLPRQTRRGPW